MVKAAIENGHLIYRKFLKTIELPLQDILWGYLQIEEVKASMCCGSFNTEIGRAIFLDSRGRKHVIQYEGTDKARKLLEQAQKENPQMAVGYTPENRQRFLAAD